MGWRKIYKEKGIPQQSGSVDCGLFVLMFIQCIVFPKDGIRLSQRFGQKNMRGLRVLLMFAMFTTCPIPI